MKSPKLLAENQGSSCFYYMDSEYRVVMFDCDVCFVQEHNNIKFCYRGRALYKAMPKLTEKEYFRLLDMLLSPDYENQVLAMEILKTKR